MYISLLQKRLVRYLHLRVQNGEASERSLARQLGISQPHLHNVLKGARELSPAMADQVLVRLQMSVVDLLSPEERATPVTPGVALQMAWRLRPELEADGEAKRPLPPDASHTAGSAPSAR